MSEISELLRKARWYVEVYDTPEDNPEQAAVLADIDAALARAEANAGETEPAWAAGDKASVRETHASLFPAPQPSVPETDEYGGHWEDGGKVYVHGPAATQPSGTVATLERGDGKGGWIIPVDVLSEIQKDAGEWADETYLETVEAIALAVERRLSALTAGKPEQAVPSGWQEAYAKGMQEAARLVDLDAAQLEAGKLTVNATGMRMLAGYIRQRADASPAAPTAGGGDAE